MSTNYKQDLRILHKQMLIRTVKLTWPLFWCY